MPAKAASAKVWASFVAVISNAKDGEAATVSNATKTGTLRVLVRGTPFLTMKSSGVYATGRQFIGNSSSIFEAG